MDEPRIRDSRKNFEKAFPYPLFFILVIRPKTVLNGVFADTFALRSFHALVKEKPGRTPFASIKLLKADPAALEAQSEEVRMRYSKMFGV